MCKYYKIRTFLLCSMPIKRNTITYLLYISIFGYNAFNTRIHNEIKNADPIAARD